MEGDEDETIFPFQSVLWLIRYYALTFYWYHFAVESEGNANASLFAKKGKQWSIIFMMKMKPCIFLCAYVSFWIHKWPWNL